MKDFSVVIVNYRTPQSLLNCVKSIVDETQSLNFEIIVVDNDSGDVSRDLIQNSFPHVLWIQNEKNEGFGRANNIGIVSSTSDLVILLNSDTIIVENALNKIFERIVHETNNFGAATCQLLNEDGTIQKSIFHFNASFREVLSYNLLVDKLLPDLLKRKNEINAVHGACMIFRKSNLASLGFFDPDFFLYSEEFEWCHRIKKAGKELRIYDDINVLHLEEASSTNKEWNTKQRLLSTALLFKKTNGVFGLLLYLILHAFNCLTNFIFIWKMTKSYQRDYFKFQLLFWSQYGRYLEILIAVFKKPLKAR